MATKDRLKELRKVLDLSQEEFGSRIGTARNTIANYEIGLRNPRDATIVSICREFNVNEEWLRTGEGEMLENLSPDEKIAAFLGDTMRDEEDGFKKRFINMLAKLDAKDWAVLEKMAREMLGETEQ